MEKIAIYVIKNEISNKICIGSVLGNVSYSLRSKLAGINHVLRKKYTSTINNDMKDAVREEQRNIADKIYLFEYNENDLEEFISENYTQRKVIYKAVYKDIRENIKAFISKEIFKDCEIYGELDYSKEDKEKRYSESGQKIHNLFKQGIIKQSTTTNNKYSKNMSFIWKEENLLSLEDTKESKQIEIMEPIKVISDSYTDNLLEYYKQSKKESKQYKLLEIESVLRDVNNVDDLIESIISDKARLIYSKTIDK